MKGHSASALLSVAFTKTPFKMFNSPKAVMLRSSPAMWRNQVGTQQSIVSVEQVFKLSQFNNINLRSVIQFSPEPLRFFKESVRSKLFS